MPASKSVPVLGSPRDRIIGFEHELHLAGRRRATAFGVSVGAVIVLSGALILLLDLTGTTLWGRTEYGAALLTVLGMMVALYSGNAIRRTRRLELQVLETLEQEAADHVRMKKQYRRVLQIATASRSLISKRAPDILFHRITQICFDAFECERASLMILDPRTNELVVRSAVGHGDMDLVLGARQNVGDGIAGWVGEHRKPLLLGPQIDVQKFWRFKPKVDPIHAAMAAPIVYQDRLMGVICVSSRSQDSFYTQEDLRALQVLAWNTAVGLEGQTEGPEIDAERKSA